MAIAFRSSATGAVNTSSASSLSITKPSGVADGDLLILAVGRIITNTAPSGWTSLVTSGLIGTSVYSDLYYKIAASEGSSYSIPVHSSTNYGKTGMILAYTGASSTQAASTGAASSTSAGTTSVACPTLSSIPSGALCLMFNLMRGDAAAGAPSYGTGPSGWTDRGGVSATGSDYGLALRVCDNAGSAPTTTWTGNTSTSVRITVAAALDAAATPANTSRMLQFF